MCKYQCNPKVHLKPPCQDCLAEWAEDQWRLHRASELNRLAHKVPPHATDREWREHLDEVAPVVPREHPAIAI